MKNFTPSLTKQLTAVAFLLLALFSNSAYAQVVNLSTLQAAGMSNYTGSGTFAGTFTVGLTNSPSSGCNGTNGTTPSAASIGRSGGLLVTLSPSAGNANVGWGIDLSTIYYSYNNSTTNFLKKISQSGRLDCATNDDITGWGPETNMNQGIIYLRGTTSVTYYNTSNVSTTRTVPIRFILTFTNNAGTPIAVKRNGDVVYSDMSQIVKVKLEAQTDATYLTNQAAMWLASCAGHTGWQPSLTLFDDLATTAAGYAQVGFNSSWYDLSTNYTVTTSTPAGVTNVQSPTTYAGPYATNTGIEIAGRNGGITYTITNGNNASGTTANCYGFGFDPVYGMGYSLNNSANTAQGYYAAVDLTNSSVATETDYTDLSIGKIVLYGASNITFSYATGTVATVRLKYLVQFTDGAGTNVPVEWRNGKIFRKLPNNGSSVTKINIRAFAMVSDLYKNTGGTATTPFWAVGGYTSTTGWMPALDVFDYLATTAANLAITTVTFEYYTLPVPSNTITVTESPVVGSSTDATICAGGTVTLAPPAGYSAYSWSGGTVSGNNTTANTSGTYTVTITEGTFGCRATGSQVVTVNPLPTPTITPTTAVCSGSTGNVYTTQSGMTNYNWTVTGGTVTAGGGTSDNTVTVTWGAAGTGHVKVNYTNSNGCSATAQTDQSITINALPTPTITPSTAVCSGATGNVYTTQSGMTNYLWTVTGGSVTAGGGTSDNTVTVTWGAAGTGHVKVNYTNANGCTATAQTDQNITINALPSPTVTPTAAVCSGSTGNVYTTQSGMSNYNWTVTGGSVTAGGGTTNNTVTITWGAAGTGHVKVNYNDANGCAAAAQTDQSITINPLPTPTISPTTAVCAGSTGNVYTTQSGMTNYNWTVTGGSVTAGGGTSDNTVTVTWGAAGTGHVKVNYTNGNGCTATAQTDQSITINGLPTPTITPTTSVCANSTGNVYTTQSGMTNYNWTVTGGSVTAGGGTSDNTVTVSWTTTNPGHVKVNYTDANGCSAASQTDQPITVTVIAAPTGSTSQSFCAIDYPTVASLVATGTAIQWYAASTGGSPLATSTALVDGNHYYATQTVGGCESPTRLDVKVAISDPPAPTGSTTQNFCAINSPIVANLSATGTSIQWYTVSTGGTPLSTSAALSSGHYYASQTVAGCQSINRLDVTVTVGNPAAPTGSTAQNFCSNNSTTVGDLTATGTAIQWYSTASGGSPLSGATALVSGDHYYASQTVSGCESATRLDVLVTIYTAPTPTVAPTGLACELTTGNVYTTQSGGSGYSWTVTGGTITAGGGSSDNTATITWGAAGTGHIIINYTDANGCTATTATDETYTISDAVTADADVTNLAAPGASSTQIEVCGALGTTLVANSPSLGVGTWSQVAGSGTTTYSPSANDNSVTTTISGYSAPATVTYRWTVVNGGCSAYSDVVVVYDPPIVISSVLAGCSFVPLPPFSNDSIMILVTATGGSSTLSFSYPPSDELRINVNSGTKVYTAPTDGNSHNFSVSDAFCSQSSAQTTPATHITDIPFTSTTGVDSAKCFDKNFNKWVTFRDATNNALLSINDNNQDLGRVTVTTYRDGTAQVVNNASTNVCPGVQSVAMKRHFVITSTVAPTSPVTVRLYFTPTELSDLISESHANDISGNSCTELDNINNLNELYVTKYTGSLEDGDYSNNDAAGTYRVFGNTTSLPTQPDGPLNKYSNGFPSLFDSGSPYHYVEFSVTEFSEIWMHGSQNATPLPVEMIYFEANAIDNSYIQLKWATELEINNHGFQVERSLDGQNWGVIGWVDGHNNSTTQQSYTYNDYNVQPNVRYYYRLKQVDNDGMFEYTSIVSAIISGDVTFNVKDFVPNPTAQNTSLIVTATTEQEVTVNLYNAIGQVVTSNSYHLNKGGNQLTFDLSQLAVGTYTAVLSSANDIYSRKLVITR